MEWCCSECHRMSNEVNPLGIVLFQVGHVAAKIAENVYIFFASTARNHQCRNVERTYLQRLDRSCHG